MYGLFGRRYTPQVHLPVQRERYTAMLEARLEARLKAKTQRDKQQILKGRAEELVIILPVRRVY